MWRPSVSLVINYIWNELRYKYKCYINCFFFLREILDLEEEMVSLAPQETPDLPARLDHPALEE